jgi:hypothetical protein
MIGSPWRWRPGTRRCGSDPPAGSRCRSAGSPWLIETWNNVDNRFMINVNEAIGYRLSQVYATFERNLNITR